MGVNFIIAIHTSPICIAIINLTPTIVIICVLYVHFNDFLVGVHDISRFFYGCEVGRPVVRLSMSAIACIATWSPQAPFSF